MLKQKGRKTAAGITLIELLIAMAIFGVLIGVFYESFSATTQNVSDLAVKQEMTQKGQRALDYIGEQLRLAGLFIGPTPAIQFCTNNVSISNPVNSLTHVNTPPNEAISYLTSERITTTTEGSPYLSTTAFAGTGSSVLPVNANSNTVSAITDNAGTGTIANADAFITLDTLQPNLGNLVYQVSNFSATSITVTPSLNQNVNALGNLYQVILKQISVDANRNLILTRWDNGNAPYGFCNPYPVNIIASQGFNAGGGVDGFVVEFTLAGGTQKATIASTDIANVREISIWLLLRSDFPVSKTYLNTHYVNANTYTLGNANRTTLKFNDQYRRLLLTKSVEVKNVGF